MSFRIEEKIRLHISDLNKFKIFLSKNTGKLLYPKRKIFSTYLDNKNFEMYKDSEEGVSPRKKIRVRNYPNSLNADYKLEKKISSVEGKFKSSRKINIIDKNQIDINGVYDSQYGTCNNVINVSYIREYFVIFDVRITIDYDIKYESYFDSRFFLDRNILVVELKSNNNIINVLDKVSEFFPFQRERYSKYCKGIDSLYNIKSNYPQVI